MQLFVKKKLNKQNKRKTEDLVWDQEVDIYESSREPALDFVQK